MKPWLGGTNFIDQTQLNSYTQRLAGLSFFYFSKLNLRPHISLGVCLSLSLPTKEDI